jgi:hypothetical protein
VAGGDLWNGGNVEAFLVALNDDIELAQHRGLSSPSGLDWRRKLGRRVGVHAPGGKGVHGV